MSSDALNSDSSLWAGRFDGGVHPLVASFTYAVQTDIRLYRFDVEGSIAHAKMLSRCGIIPSSDSERIISHLQTIKADIEAGKIDFAGKEDVHMAVEEELIRRDGEAGSRLHAARSRNDQIALDERLWLREEITQLESATGNLQKTLLGLAGRHTDTIIPGLTHMQYAQPVVLAHHLLAYFWMLARDKDRLHDCWKRADKSPLGAGALAGTSLPIDRSYTAAMLGFSGITENSLDTVSDRDYLIEFLMCLSLMMMHLSRLSEDLIYWYSPGCDFIRLEDSFATGSSLMPHKKNADVLELLRGKTSRTYGALMALLSLMKGLPLSYNRDMQEDKAQLFEVTDEAAGSLSIMTEFLQATHFNTQQMERAAARGFFAATDLAEYLVQKGMPFREAHHTVGKMVRWCVGKGCTFENLRLEDFKNFSPLFGDDVQERLTARACASNKESAGGTGREAMKRQLQQARRYLESEE
jgi:argininosuccinate lyase